jgi:hypothetical protein
MSNDKEKHEEEKHEEEFNTETTGDIGGSTMHMEVTNFALPREKPAKGSRSGKKQEALGVSFEGMFKKAEPRWDLVMPALERCGIVHRKQEGSVCHFTVAIPSYASAVWGWEEEDDLAMSVGLFTSNLDTLSNLPQRGRVFHVVCSLLSHSKKNTDLFDATGIAVVMAKNMAAGYEFTSRLNAHGGTGNMVLEDLHEGFQGGLIKFKQTILFTDNADDNALTMSAVMERGSDMLLATIPYYRLLGQKTPEELSQMHMDKKLRRKTPAQMEGLVPDGAQCIGSLSGDEFTKLLMGDPEMLKKHGTLLAMLSGLMGGKMDLAKLLEELRKRRKDSGQSDSQQEEEEDE